MILTVEEFRTHYQTDESDAMLEEKLKAIELMIRAYTNNNFIARGFRQDISITNGSFSGAYLLPFKVGDTVMITKSQWHDGLYTIRAIDGTSFTVNEATEQINDAGAVTKVLYPLDVVMGAVNLMKWDLERRDKVGIASETLSRHSVTYADMTNDNTLVGYPKMLISFLFPYKRARIGG